MNVKEQLMIRWKTLL